MHSLRRTCSVVTPAIFLIGAAGIADAQENALSFSCNNVGAQQARESLGDREGHAISVGEYSCRAETAPLGGGVWTQTNLWEWNKTDAAIVESTGVIRKPGATTVVKITEGSISLTIADGKMTGVTGSGRGVFPIAVGGAGSLAGKTWTHTVKSTTPPAQFSLEMKLD
jgi:hypothetical protein